MLRKKISVSLFLFSLLNAAPDVASHEQNLTNVILRGTYINVNLLTRPTDTVKAKVIGVIADDLYGFHGRRILIPKGSTATCLEIANYIPSDCRTRILTPTGRYIIFDGSWRKIGNSIFVYSNKDLQID